MNEDRETELTNAAGNWPYADMPLAPDPTCVLCEFGEEPGHEH
jgi:hypothetical protein